MNSRKFTILATLTLFLISLTFLYGCGGQDNKSGTQVNSNQQQAEEQYKIRLNHGLPQEHFMALEIQEWADLVEQKSDGRLKIEMYPSAQLYKDPDLIQAVRSGVIEAGATYNFLFENLIPEFEPLVFPRIMTSTRHMHNVINGDVGNILMSRVEENDMKVLSWLYWPVETTGTISNKPIHVPSDMKGMKFRTTGGIQAVLLKKVGASSSYISGAEMYMALQRRTIDGGLQNNFAHVLDRKFYEVSPYYTITKMGQTVDLIIINKKFYDSLPVDLQQILVDSGREMQEKSVTIAEDRYEKLLPEMKSVMKEVILLTKEEEESWDKLSQEVWQETLDKADPETRKIADEIIKMR